MSRSAALQQNAKYTYSLAANTVPSRYIYKAYFTLYTIMRQMARLTRRRKLVNNPREE